MWLLLRLGSGAEDSIAGTVTRHPRVSGTADEAAGRSVPGAL